MVEAYSSADASLQVEHCATIRAKAKKVDPVMTLTNVLAGIAVEDLSQSLVWYEYLFGRPADAHTMRNVAEWKLPGGGWVHVTTDEDRAGASFVTLIVADLADEIDRLDMFGIKPVSKAIGDFFKTAKFRDPDGNLIILSQPQPGTY
jgi:catechol 2,3-dioxygenase-like lactoylglutathione lyase family enzyme